MTSQNFVLQLLADYLSLPFVAPHRPSTLERKLALDLYHRHVSLDTARAAFLHAAARRLSSSLPPVRSLAYFLPIIDELTNLPPHPDYIRYLEYKLAASAASVHFSTLSDDR